MRCGGPRLVLFYMAPRENENRFVGFGSLLLLRASSFPLPSWWSAVATVSATKELKKRDGVDAKRELSRQFW